MELTLREYNDKMFSILETAFYNNNYLAYFVAKSLNSRYQNNEGNGELEKITKNIKSAFISKNEKIYVLKDILNKIYRDYEITTGIIDEPYFIKAEKKIRRIIRENKVDYYYNLLKKFRNY